MFYKQLIGKSEEETDSLMQEYITKYRKRYDKPKLKYVTKFELWIEYLKRSTTYKKACDWFEGARSNYPYPDNIIKTQYLSRPIEDYLIFVSSFYSRGSISSFDPMLKDSFEIPAARFGLIQDGFFGWAVSAGFPKELSDEILMYLHNFGNIYKDPHEFILLRVLFFIEHKISRTITSVTEPPSFKRLNNSEKSQNADDLDTENSKISRNEIDQMFRQHLGTGKTDAEPIDKRHQIDSSLYLNICILNPFEDKDMMVEEFKRIIDYRRKEVLQLFPDNPFNAYRINRFEWFNGKVYPDELTRYLDIYDQKLTGKSDKELILELYPNLQEEFDPSLKRKKDADAIKTAYTIVARDAKFAKKIIDNVESGYFPGNYQ